MDKDTRNRIQRATQAARVLLEHEYAEQLEGVFDIRLDGTIAAEPGEHLDPDQRVLRTKLVTAVEHQSTSRMTSADAVGAYLRKAAFTTLNRFVALKMLEARELVQECISRGDQSAGFKEFTGLAAALVQLPDNGYRIYVESLFDEIGREVRVLFDRRDPASLLWPRRQALLALLAVLNATELASVWGEDETIGWVYQYFNSDEERRAMRSESQAPRNSRELAVRNQFFTPRYVVQFLTANTLGRIWYEMRQGHTRLGNLDYLVCRPNEVFLAEGEAAPADADADDEKRTQEDSPKRPVHVPFRAKKDPRDIRVLDPACGSGHFLLYAFELLVTIYEEAWNDEASPTSEATGRTLRQDYPELGSLHAAVPGNILSHNLHGVDIDPRCSQIAALALWMRAQREFKDIGIPRASRPTIHKTNIVVAESMPGDPALVAEFADRLTPPLLRGLFCKMVSEMELAGELGVLLRVENGIAAELRHAHQQFVERRRNSGYLPGMKPPRKQGEIDLSGIDDDHFFHEAESRILHALQEYALAATGSESVRQRLFAEDAAQGIALVDLLHSRFDVLLMNPPFGDATPAAAAYLDAHYNSTRLDLFAAFCERLLELVCHDDGLVGAITPRDGFFKKTLAGWRELVLAHGLTVVADLGIGVLDSATVRVSAYVISSAPSDVPTRFIDLVDLPDRDKRLLAEVRSPQRVHDAPLRSFRFLPLARFLYWLPSRLWEVFAVAPPIENAACTPRYGLTTLDDQRFCRLSFEVTSAQIGPKNSWSFMSKGGDVFPYGGVSNAVVRWQDDAAEMAEVNRQSNGQIAQTRRASKYYFRPAIAYSNRSVQFSVRWHPANFAFSVRGPVVVPLHASQAYLLGFFNSRLVRALVQMQTASQTYTSGVLKELRWIEPDANTQVSVEQCARSAFDSVRLRLATVETDPLFEGLIARTSSDTPTRYCSYQSWRKQFVGELNSHLRSVQLKLDAMVAALYGVASADIARCERVDDADMESREFPPPFGFALSDAEALASYLFGVALGRWTVRLAGNLPALDSSAPSIPPATSEGESAFSILVDDEGHQDDLVLRVIGAMPQVLSASTEHDIALLKRELGTNLRTWFSRSYFARHISVYSAVGRKAPLYWQLATLSGRYSVWLYYHRVSRDTLYRLLNEYATPKLKHEERKLANLIQDAGSNPSASKRMQIEEQERFVSELLAFSNEVARVAPLWNPNLNDGVIINFAPLWRLVPQNRAWQNECRKTWDALCKGDYDWAHLAMSLWPERVVLKCARDRSLAIAHDLEDVFWSEDSDGKGRSRKVEQTEVEKLIKESTSAAVKDALKSLLEAPGLATVRSSRMKAPRAKATRKGTVSMRRTVATIGDSSTSGSSSAVAPELLREVKGAIGTNGEGASKADVIGTTGITASEWSRVIKALLADGSVTQTGERRGARYRLVDRTI